MKVHHSRAAAVVATVVFIVASAVGTAFDDAMAQPRRGAIHVDPAPIPEEVIERLVRGRPNRPVPIAVETLNRLLADADALLDDIAAGVRAADNDDDRTAAPRMVLGSKLQEIAGARADLHDELARVRARLLTSGAGGDVDAFDAFAKGLEGRLDAIVEPLEQLIEATTRNARQHALARARGTLRKLLDDAEAADAPPLMRPAPTVVAEPTMFREPDRLAAPVPAYLASTFAPDRRLASLDIVAVPPPAPGAPACAYASADLAGTPDAPLTEEIRGLAASLDHSPVRLFRYVAERIAFQPYYGSLKGATGTLVSGSGNATDQASLLVALLRASNVPARYVKGIARFEADDPRLPRWLGTKTHYAAAVVLSLGRIPVYAWSGAVEFTHVWVEACVPYTNYRGTAVDTTGQRWIPLDPSFKEFAYQPGYRLQVAFDYTSYMAQRTNVLPHEQYATQLEAIIRRFPQDGWSTAATDIGYVGVLQPRALDILPASLPYQVTSFTAWDADVGPSAETAALPARHRHSIEIIARRGADPDPSLTDMILRWSTVFLSMPEVVLKRITLSYKGATAADQALLDAWRLHPDPDRVVPCTPTINVTPVIKVDGIEQPWTAPRTGPAMTGGPVPLCSFDNRLVVRLTMTELAWASLVDGRVVDTGWYGGELNTATFRTLRPIDHHALFVYAFQASDRLLRERAAKLLATLAASSNVNADVDETEGEFLHIVGLKYMRYSSDVELRVGELDQASGQSGNHIGMTLTRSKVARVADVPFGVYRNGFVIDVPSSITRSVDIVTGVRRWETYKLAGYAGSAYESYIWQENLRLDAMSSVRGLQYARETGTPVVRLESTAEMNRLCWQGNAEQPAGCPPAYLYSAREKDQIRAWLEDGYTVELPRQLIQYGNWKGSVYIAEYNRPDGVGASYMINGSYAGGETLLGSGRDVPSWEYDAGADSGYVLATPTSPTISTTPFTLLDGGRVTTGACAGQTCAGDPVHMVTGNMYHVERDISITGRGGLPIVFERHYNSLLNAQDGPLGFGWTHTFNQSLLFRDDNADGAATSADTDGVTSSVLWTDGTGAQKIIRVTGEATTCGPGPGASFTTPRGYFFTVTRNPDLTYTIRETSGLTYTFENVEGIVGARAKLTRVADRNGNALTLTYTAGRLTSVSDDSNRALTFTLDGAGHITRVTDFGGRTHRYTYDASGNLMAYYNPLALSGVQDPMRYTYYSAGPLNHVMQSYVLPRGNGMTFEYYANGRVFRHYTSQGETTMFTYNDFRRESVSVNERGFTRRYFFDEYGSPVRIVEEGGAEWKYTYDANAETPYNRLSQIGPLGHETKYCYDARGRVTREITSWAVATGETCATVAPGDGTVLRQYFNAFDQPGKIKDGRGNYTILKYDARGNLTQRIVLRAGVGASITNPAAYAPAAPDVVAWTIKTYDAYGNLLTAKQVRDPSTQAGPTVTYVYDAQFLYATAITRRGDKDGDGVIGATEADSALLGHDAFGRATHGITADWYPTALTYDAADRVVTFTDRLGNVRRRGYDANGNTVFESLPGVDHWSAGYDTSDRKVVTQNVAGMPTTYRYDAAGNVIATTNPDGFTLGFEYDAANRVVRAMDQEGLSVKQTRDVAGNVRTTTDPNGHTRTFLYYGPAAHGRLNVRVEPNVRPAEACILRFTGLSRQDCLETVYEYDAAGNVTKTTVFAPLGGGKQETMTTYDALNRPTRVVGPVVADPVHGTIRPVTRYAYGAPGTNVLGYRTRIEAGRTNAAGDFTADVVTTQMTWVWDDFGRKIRETDAAGRTWTMTYDVHGNLLTVRDARGQTTSFTWGYGHQMLTRSAGGKTTRWTRNELGQVLQVFHPDPTLLYTYTYDAMHRLETVTDHRGGKTLTYSYSAGGLLNFVEDGDGNRTDYVHDGSGRLAEIWAPNGDVVTYVRDAAGRLVEKWMPNGVSARYEHNGDDTVASVTNAHGSTVVSEHAYTYDGFGNRRTHTETVAGVTTPYRYSHDNLNRLTRVEHATTLALIESNEFDILGNRTNRTSSTGAVTAFVYDALNQLTQARQGTTTGPLLAGFVYDANGNLVKKCEGGTVTRTDTTCAGTTVTTLTHDAHNQVTQVAKTGLATQAYAYDDQGRRIQKTVGGIATHYLYNGDDIHATYSTWTSPTATYTHGPATDDPVLRIVGTATHYFHGDGLGSVMALTSGVGAIDATARYDAWGNRIASTGTLPIYGYTGREPDETGLIHYRARYYDPSVGRFTQRDPIGLAGGPNLYLYAAANPLRLIDPNGTLPTVPAAPDAGYAAAAPSPGLSAGTQSLAHLHHVSRDPVTGRWSSVSETDAIAVSIVAINGILTDLDAAVVTMARAVERAHPSALSFTLFHNPTEGLLRDAAETLLDKLGFTTKIAREFSAVLQSAQKMDRRIDVVAMSQAGVIFAESVRWGVANGAGSFSNIGLHCIGCANNPWVSGRIFSSAGITRVKYDDNRNDFIPNIIGLHSLDPRTVGGSMLSLPLLLAPGSLNPHYYK
jgi:RHS repeat-associated protein